MHHLLPLLFALSILAVFQTPTIVSQNCVAASYRTPKLLSNPSLHSQIPKYLTASPCFVSVRLHQSPRCSSPPTDRRAPCLKIMPCIQHTFIPFNTISLHYTAQLSPLNVPLHACILSPRLPFPILYPRNAPPPLSLAEGLSVGLFPQRAANRCMPALCAGEICSIVSVQRSPLDVEVV